MPDYWPTVCWRWSEMSVSSRHVMTMSRVWYIQLTPPMPTRLNLTVESRQRRKTSALALCYSTAEYWAPVWARSPYITDWCLAELTCALSLELYAQHLFRGCQSSATSLSLTFGEWQQQINFSVRSGPQPSLCPWYQTSSPILKSALHQDVLVWLEEPQQEEVSPRQKWTKEWAASDVVNRLLIVDPFIAPSGFDLRRRLWLTLNHFRTDQGRCAANLVRWNQASDPSGPVAHLHKLCRTLWTIV